jgi:hypothetical protein
MQNTDSIQQAQQFPEGVIAMFNEQIVNNIVDSEGTNHSVISSSTSNAIASAPCSFSISNSGNVVDSNSVIDANAIPKARIVLSYDNIVQLLRERIENCRNQKLVLR